MITFSTPTDEFLKDVDVKDLFYAMSQITENLTLNPVEGKEIKVYIGKYKWSHDLQNINMMTATIEVEFLNENGTKWEGEWKSYRAKNHNCSQRDFARWLVKK